MQDGGGGAHEADLLKGQSGHSVAHFCPAGSNHSQHCSNRARQFELALDIRIFLLPDPPQALPFWTRVSHVLYRPSPQVPRPPPNGSRTLSRTIPPNYRGLPPIFLTVPPFSRVVPCISPLARPSPQVARPAASWKGQGGGRWAWPKGGHVTCQALPAASPALLPAGRGWARSSHPLLQPTRSRVKLRRGRSVAQGGHPLCELEGRGLLIAPRCIACCCSCGTNPRSACGGY